MTRDWLGPEIVVSTRRVEERPKTWEQITDEEIVQAVAFCCERDRDGVARGAQHVNTALSNSTPEQWPGAGPNAAYGLGLIPRFGEGSASNAKIAARLKRLAKEGKLVAVEMVTPRGKPSSPGYRVP